MPKQIEVSDETYAHLEAFGRIAHNIMTGPLESSELADVLIRFGMRETLAILWGSLEPSDMLEVLQQLVDRTPQLAYGLVADHLEAGDAVHREALKFKFGFHQPTQG
jgi:hypothetical protein